MHNIDEKGRRKDVLLTTAVSEKLMRKSLHTYLETLDERYVEGQSRSRTKLVNYIFALEYKLFGIQKVLMKENCWFID